MPDLQLFIGDAVPLYADFRREVDALYPALAARIAIRHKMPDDRPHDIAEDLREQIAPDILALVPEKTYDALLRQFYSFWPRNKSGGFCMSFFDLTKSDCSDVHYCYLALGDIAKDPRDKLADLSAMHEYRVGAMMKFNKAALDAPMIGWFHFYHELEHAVSTLEQTARDSDYERLLREARADAFAALHLLKRFGARAVPLIETIADMRLSNFFQSGPDHFTTPVLRAVVANHKSGVAGAAAPALSADFNKAADRYAHDHFLHREDVEAYAKAQKSRGPFEGGFIYQRRENVLQAYCDQPKNASMPWRTRQKALFEESETILEKSYFNFGNG